MIHHARRKLFCILLSSLIIVTTACGKGPVNTIDDSTLPTNEMENVTICTLDGTDHISINSNANKLQTVLLLENRSEYEIDYPTDVYVRLQKKANGEWVFSDNNPYPGGPSQANMITILPDSPPKQINVSIGIDPKTFDYDGEYRLYLPIEYRPLRTSDQGDSNQIKKACVTIEILLDVNSPAS